MVAKSKCGDGGEEKGKEMKERGATVV